MSQTKIKITAYSGNGVDSFYIKGVKGKWEENIRNSLNASGTSANGDIVSKDDPCQLMTGMGITFEFDDQRQASQNNSGANAHSDIGGDAIWDENGVVFVRRASLKSEAQLREAFKTKYNLNGGNFDKNKKYWIVNNSTLGDVQAFFNSDVSSLASPANGNAVFNVTADEMGRFQSILNHISNNGIVSVSH